MVSNSGEKTLGRIEYFFSISKKNYGGEEYNNYRIFDFVGVFLSQ